MDEYKKCILIDKLLILCGVLGVIAEIVAIVLGLLGEIQFDINYVILFPVSVFFIVYGAKLIKKDNDRFHRK